MPLSLPLFLAINRVPLAGRIPCFSPLRGEKKKNPDSSKSFFDPLQWRFSSTNASSRLKLSISSSMEESRKLYPEIFIQESQPLEARVSHLSLDEEHDQVLLCHQSARMMLRS